MLAALQQAARWELLCLFGAGCSCIRHPSAAECGDITSCAGVGTAQRCEALAKTSSAPVP